MTLYLSYRGFNYPAFYNGGYENGDTLSGLAATGSNSAALEDEYGIDVNTSSIVTDPNYTDSLASLGATIKEAVQDGQQVMVRPLIDFLDPAIDGGLTGDYRSYFNPSNVSAFFASYKTILLQQATVAQQAGASLFCIGTEIDQLTGPKYLSQWTDIISAVRAVFKGKLTYSAEWDDNTSPWQYGGTGLALGTGNITTQVSFWNQLDYVGIDEYAPISDAANPTQQQLLDGWEKVPTDASALAVTGQQSLISYFDGVSAAIGKPLLFTELGYEDATDAASQPFGSSTNVVDQSLQTSLYKAFFDAWSAKGNGSLAGVNFWNWDPYANETEPKYGPNFSPQSNPAALQVIENGFAAAACYCPGTLILTDRGEVAVEALRIGNRVVTHAGEARPIRWIGRRSYAGATLHGQHLKLPVCIRQGALGPALPKRDLYVSPGHALYIEGRLVPAWRLINGVSVLQPEDVDQVAYFHVELETHEIIFANGAPAESYLDTGNRGQFHNADEFAGLYPGLPAMQALDERLEDGFDLLRIQQAIAHRAGLEYPGLEDAGEGTLRGYVDVVTPGRVSGWAQHVTQPESPVSLLVAVGGKPLGRVLANLYREDLRAAGLGSGCHGFIVRLPAGQAGAVEVRPACDSTPLAFATGVAPVVAEPMGSGRAAGA